MARELTRHADEEQAKRMSACMLDKFPYLGVLTPIRRTVCKPFFAEAKREAGVDWSFVARCWEDRHRELQYAAMDYLVLVQGRLTPSDIPNLGELIVTKSWWDTADTLDRVVGDVALRFPEVNETLMAWSRSGNIWLRRVAIDHQLLRKERTDRALLEEILVNSLGREKFFINKAIGWALRDFSKTDPEWVRSFIGRYGGRMASLSVREGSKYLQGAPGSVVSPGAP